MLLQLHYMFKSVNFNEDFLIKLQISVFSDEHTHEPLNTHAHTYAHALDFHEFVFLFSKHITSF